MSRRILLRSDGSERVPYNYGDYRAYIKHGRLSRYRNMNVACHWHDDWEFIFMEKGKMGYFVNGVNQVLYEGQGIFVNSRCMHYNYAIDGEDAHYLCMLIHPSLADAVEQIRSRYVQPLIDNPGMKYRMLDRSNALSILNAMDAVMRAAEEESPAAGLTLMHSLFQILERLYADMAALPLSAADADPRLEMLHRMIGYVQAHYSTDVLLGDIADAGHVSKSSCCSIFRKYLGQTPVGYLTHYRLERASELLNNTNLSVTEIAIRTGFASQSYFTETFRKHCGVTPTEFRRRQTPAGIPHS